MKKAVNPCLTLSSCSLAPSSVVVCCLVGRFFYVLFLLLIGAITYPIKNWLKRRERHGLDLDFVYEEIFMASGASRKAWTCKDTHALTQVDNVDNYFQNTWGTNTTVAFLDAATM